MAKVECIIIGAGVVGLALAECLSRAGREVVVLEQHDSFGRETSSRNSEVIHAGIYYPAGALKTKLCVRGSRLLYDFCRQYHLPCRQTGKLVIATCREEIPALEALYENATGNGVSGLSLLDENGVSGYEPLVTAAGALYSATTGIIDTHCFMQCLARLSEEQGSLLAYGCRVTALASAPDGYEVSYTDTGSRQETIRAEIVINAAGLSADRIAALAGIATAEAGYSLFYAKGEYFSLTGVNRNLLSRLVYPVPAEDHPGIHTVLDLQGRLKLGPNAYYVDTIDYRIDETYKTAFHDSAKKFLPFIKPENLVPEMAGIRPRLRGPGYGFTDFVICHEKERGLPGFINLIGIESPGLTCALAIAEYVSALL